MYKRQGVFLVTVISCIFAGAPFVAKYAGDTNMVVWAFIQGFTFSAGVTVILTGVRMILAELVPAFKGIAEKIVPDAIPALDCPTAVSYTHLMSLMQRAMSFNIPKLFMRISLIIAILKLLKIF